MKFSYTARTKDGQLKTGEIEASSMDSAAKLLQKYDIFITSIKEEASGKSFLKKLGFEVKVSKKELAIFSRQMGIMLESRVPVVQSLSGLAMQNPNRRFKKILLDVVALVEEGKPLSEAFAHYPNIFSNFYVNLIKSGEASGRISETLYFLSDSLEQEYDISSQFKQAITYPFLVFAVLSVVIIIIIVALVPRIDELVRASNVAPSLFTVIMLAFYKFLSFYWWIIVSLAFLVFFSLVYYLRTKSGKEQYDILSLQIPYLKDVLKKIYLVIFCNNIATLISAGVSISRALEITESTINNSVYRNSILKIRQGVAEGEKISSMLLSYKDYFPPFVVQMIRVGEDTGKLEKTLLEVSKFYQKEIQRAINAFSTLLEPLLIIVLGIIVTLVAISVLSPLYNILDTL